MVNIVNTVFADFPILTTTESTYVSDNRYLNVAVTNGFLVVPMTCQVHKDVDG